MAKGIANGLPLGAIVARASVMDWPSGSHASTFGGNPVACAASLATIRLLETRYIANANRRGLQLRDGLAGLADRYSFIREVRGLGLMIGVEIQSESGDPAPALRDELIDLAFHRGLLLLPCGPSTIRFCPPLCLTARQVEIGLRLLSTTMEAAAVQMSSIKANGERARHELEELAAEPT
jgi:4-aminobutyrate aminotransferase